MIAKTNHNSSQVSPVEISITRRDFLNGVPVAVGGAVVGGLLPEFVAAAFAGESSPQDAAGYYPPALSGLRGNHPGSFETAHALRDADFWSRAGTVAATGEDYDLVVVGGGISGLAAAHFYRARHQTARILVLDNHDDFGGHAKRNEFEPGGRLALMNGGTFSIDSPRPYSAVADGLLKTLGVDPVALTKKSADRNFYPSLGLSRGVFFDRETFGVDKLVVATAGSSWSARLAMSPLPLNAQRDIVRIEEEQVDYFPGLSSDEKKARLSRMSYRDFLLDVVKADPAVIPFYQARTHGEWGVGIDAVSALERLGFRLSRFSRFEARARLCAEHGLYRRRLCRRRVIHVPFSRRQCLDRPAVGAQSRSGVRAGRERRRYRCGASRLFASRSSAIAGAHSAQLNGRARVPYRRSGCGGGSGDRICARRRALFGARPILRARLLQRDDPVPLSGIAGQAERGAAICVEDTADLRERGFTELAAVQGFGYRAGLCTGLVFFIAGAEPGGRYRQLPELAIAGRAGAPPHDARAGPSGTARARSASGRTARHSEYQLSDVRARHSRPTRPYPRPRWVRFGARHHGHHRQPLAARLRLRVQSAVRSGLAGGSGAARDRPGALRPDHHRQLGCRCRRLY